MRSPPRRRSPGALILVALVLGLGSCVEFDREDQVTDLRILAVQLDTPEVLYSPLLVFGPSPGGGALTEVAVDVIAADPRGGTLKVSLRLCPEVAGDDACDDFDDGAVDELVASLPEVDRAQALLALHPADLSIDVGSNADGVVVASAVGLTHARFTVALPQSLLRALLPAGPDGAPRISLTAAFPRFVVAVENPGATGVAREVAIKRLSLTLDTSDPALPAAAIAPLLTAFGLEACSAEAEARPPIEGVADCLRAPRANENPELIGFVFDRDDAPDGGVFTDEDSDGDGIADFPADVGIHSIVRVRPGDDFRIDPVITAASFAPYQGFRLDVESGTQILENRREDLALEWFSTTGDVGNATTSQQGGFGGGGGGDSARLGTTFTSRIDASPGDLDSIVVVLHDQRGGVAIGQIDVEYR